MAYGKLAVIKTYGEKPIFSILDKEDRPTTIIPDFHDWMMKRVGHKINLFISDKYFQVTDEECKE